MKILITDDNSMNRRMFIRLLKDEAVEIDEAESGAQCLEMTAQKAYDRIFLDHMMPEMDGVETLRRLKAAGGPNAQIPVIALTANAGEGAREEYLAYGFDDYLAKPVKKESLARWLSAESTGEAAGDGEAERSLAEDFCILADTQAGKLQKAFEELPADPNALLAYRIQVHGMKSNAAAIGETALAEAAQQLETAAKNRDADTIKAGHTAFLQGWKAAAAGLKERFGFGSDAAGSEKADNALILALLETAVHSVEDMDPDTADSAVNRLFQYRLEGAQQELAQELRAAVTDLDEDRCRDIADRWRGLL